MRIIPNALDPPHDRGSRVRERIAARQGSSVIAANLMRQPNIGQRSGRGGEMA
jgi:hypothetical protein